MGNAEPETIKSFVKACYKALGDKTQLISVSDEHFQRSYFPFHNYSYVLDVSEMLELMPETIPFSKGIRESYEWYRHNSNEVNKKPYFDYIDRYLK